MKDWVPVYAAIVATVVAIIQISHWRAQRVGAKLSVSSRMHPTSPPRCSHIEIDIQATHNSTSIRAIYLAAYKWKWQFLLGREPSEIIGSSWNKIFPIKIEPGHGWEGLMAINDKERALAASYNHVRVMIRHTGYGRVISKPIIKFLRT